LGGAYEQVDLTRYGTLSELAHATFLKQFMHEVIGRRICWCRHIEQFLTLVIVHVCPLPLRGYGKAHARLFHSLND
jgi:hypothetical protein